MNGTNFNGGCLLLAVAIFIFICKVVKTWILRSKNLQKIEDKLGNDVIKWMIGE